MVLLFLFPPTDSHFLRYHNNKLVNDRRGRDFINAFVKEMYKFCI